MPITLPRRLHISTYGGRSPTARSMLATTPRIIMGKFIPRSYNGFSVNINAASTPPSTSQIIPVRDVAFHTGQRLDKCELDWKLLMRKILLVVDQSLCPTDQAKCTEDLWLDLDGDVEILGICKRKPYVPRQLPNLGDRISSKWNSTNCP